MPTPPNVDLTAKKTLSHQPTMASLLNMKVGVRPCTFPGDLHVLQLGHKHICMWQAHEQMPDQMTVLLQQ